MEKMTLYDAYAHIKIIRGIINPNEGFWQQMVEYEAKKTGENSVKLERVYRWMMTRVKTEWKGDNCNHLYWSVCY